MGNAWSTFAQTLSLAQEITNTEPFKNLLVRINVKR